MKTYLLKNAQIINPGSPVSGKCNDIAVQEGKITAIGVNLNFPDATVIDLDGAYLSPGLIDHFCWNGDPGFEHRERFDTLLSAAAKGGFTDLALLPNTYPAVDKKSMIDLLRKKSQHTHIGIYPYGSISEKAEGVELAELQDMSSGGAVGFTDGTSQTLNYALLYRALEYVKMFDGLVICSPADRKIFGKGQMHEGKVSTSLGLRGIPTAAEVMAIDQCLELLRYTGSRLHLTGVSSARAVEKIRSAKKEGLSITASVAVWNLAFTDESVDGFQNNFKFDPPLREEEDRVALIHGLKDGTLDAIYSQHIPWDPEKKNLEFPFSSPGSISLQTSFLLSLNALNPHMSLEQIINLWTQGPRRILGLPQSSIAVGEIIRATAFNTSGEFILQDDTNCSINKNTPLWEKPVSGEIIGTMVGNLWL
jgi:dihydroorotase